MWLTRKRIVEQGPKWLKAGLLALAGLAALYAGTINRWQYSIWSERRAAGVAESSQPRFFERDRSAEYVSLTESASVDNNAPQLAQMAGDAAPGPPPSPIAAPDDADRKMVRTESLDLVVQHPADAAEKISQLATRLGGFLVVSDVSGDPNAASASLTIRVPAEKFEQARQEIRALGIRVESERVEAQDVTRQYVDQDAHLRNLRAEEQQYLAILKHANTVKDTLEVSEKLGEVRGSIEQQQAEFDALSKQVQTVAITVTLSAEADTQVLGLHWRPLFRLKVAARNGLDGLGDYVGAITSVAFYLPAILLWLATILIAAALGWRILRWGGRVVFGFRKPVAEKGAN